MDIHKAIELAVCALDEQRRKFAFDAGLYKTTKAPHGKRYAERYDEINQAIRVLTELKHQYGSDGTRRMFE